ncbi:hypothetical protein ACM64Y_11810 [Novispirillum sp. DQ9]|uniref:hypothetical protein n=1 Tax=Novispirillum sp. DQ9 TaxID=3398612 RepID=UPI003C7D2D54
MAQAATHLFFVNPAHTGGQSILSDIVMSDELMARLWPANEDFDILDDDFGDDEDGFMEIDDALGPLLVWRGPKRGR